MTRKVRLIPQEWILRVRDSNIDGLKLYFTGYCTSSAIDLAFRFACRDDAEEMAKHLGINAPSFGMLEVVPWPLKAKVPSN